MNKIIIFILIFLLVSCMNNNSKEERSKKNEPELADVSSAKKYETFADFVNKFFSDSIFQNNHIKFPLKVVVNDYDLKETDSIKYNTQYRYITRRMWKYTNLSNEEVDGLKIKSKLESLSNSVTLLGVDNGVHITYHFRKEDDTWILIQIEDSSN